MKQTIRLRNGESALVLSIVSHDHDVYYLQVAIDGEQFGTKAVLQSINAYTVTGDQWKQV